MVTNRETKHHELKGHRGMIIVVTVMLGRLNRGCVIRCLM